MLLLSNIRKCMCDRFALHSDVRFNRRKGGTRSHGRRTSSSNLPIATTLAIPQLDAIQRYGVSDLSASHHPSLSHKMFVLGLVCQVFIVCAVLEQIWLVRMTGRGTGFKAGQDP